MEYHVDFAGAEIYPQGFSAIADRLNDFRGVTMLCDIGNGTMNVMYIRSGKPIPTQCYTEKYGVHQCMIAVREKLMQKFGATVDDGVIEDVLRYGKADIGEKYLTAINDHFSRQERLADDPFLETRERQDAFLSEVKATVREQQIGLGGLAALLQGVQPVPQQNKAVSEEAFDTAMDFINGL